MTRSRAATALALAAAVALPFVPGVPAYWLTLASYVALSSLVALGIVVLTGVAGVVSFGQAMFVGFGAYTSAILTTRTGWPAFATLPAAILVTAALAWGIGAITLRLKGHYLPVATIAWNISFFYLAGGLDLTRRFDGISGIPPIVIGGLAVTDGRASTSWRWRSWSWRSLRPRTCSIPGSGAPSGRSAAERSRRNPSASTPAGPRSWLSCTRACWPRSRAGSTRISSAPSTPPRSRSRPRSTTS